MRLRNIPGSREVIAESPFVADDPAALRGRWREHFQNENPLYIEIGMGKGRFLMDSAALYPEINFIGIEMYSSVLIRAVQKAEEQEKPLRNILFIREDAAHLPDIFAPGEVDRIYLNFSDPWPKERHAKRRLTSDRFLRKYEAVLGNSGGIQFKTDNTDLFDFSLCSIRDRGWTLDCVSRDLHSDASLMRDNVMTEYEERFSTEGHAICFLAAASLPGAAA